MILSRRLVIRPFADADALAVAALLTRSREEYVRFFHPFEFQAPVLAALVAQSVRDQWFVLEVHENGAAVPAGFYMLRGLDEGFADPMYGVFIAEEFAGRGLARLTLAHAETQCRLHGWTRLLLKVEPQNVRALRLYERCGFAMVRVDAKSGQQVLCREWSPSL